MEGMEWMEGDARHREGGVPGVPGALPKCQINGRCMGTSQVQESTNLEIFTLYGSA